MIEADSETGFLLRVYKESVQRLPCELTSLSSNAAFIIVSAANLAQRRCILWIGSACAPADRTIAEKLSYDVAVEDFRSSATPECMTEDRENPALLEAIMQAMWVQVDDYRRAARARSTTPIANKPVSMLRLVKEAGKMPTSYRINELATESPHPSTGTVAKLVFPAGLDDSAVIAINVGDQYDMWFSENVGAADQSAAKGHMRTYAVSKAPEKRRGIESVMFARNLRVAWAREKTVFRAHFTAESAARVVFAPSSRASDRHRSHRERSGIDRGALGSTTSNTEGCSDCVGDTILRLLGITGDGPTTRLFWGAPSSDPGTGWKRDGSAEGSSAAAEDAAVQSKIQRLTSKTEIKFLNPPRWGSKLLVLDLDHTLIDFSCRFEFMFEQLKRPFLDKFLAAAYRAQYDIAIWSQTNWKWLELKLTELGMLSRKDYKICFALDKSTMFTVRQNYVKPLQLIWNKFGDRWGPKNTVRFFPINLFHFSFVVILCSLLSAFLSAVAYPNMSSSHPSRSYQINLPPHTHTPLSIDPRRRPLSQLRAQQEERPRSAPLLPQPRRRSRRRPRRGRHQPLRRFLDHRPAAPARLQPRGRPGTQGAERLSHERGSCR